jgi:hypothetical protein
LKPYAWVGTSGWRYGPPGVALYVHIT